MSIFPFIDRMRVVIDDDLSTLFPNYEFECGRTVVDCGALGKRLLYSVEVQAPRWSMRRSFVVELSGPLPAGYEPPPQYYYGMG